MKESKDLNIILAENLVYYRRDKGLTQAQLAEKLNYSDKSISKWERGEGLPDILILRELADFYSITVDDFFKEEKRKEKKDSYKRHDIHFINLLSVGIVWLVAAITFFVVLLSTNWFLSWIIFLFAVVASAIVSLTLYCIFWSRLAFIINLSILIWSTAVTTHLCLLNLTNLDGFNILYIYLIGLTLQICAIIWYLYLIYLKDKRKQKAE